MSTRIDRRVALGLGVLVLTFGAFVFVGSGRFARMFDGNGRTVKVSFAHAQQLRDFGFMRAGSDVRINGVDVGIVKSVSGDPGARSATATLGLKDSAGPIYADARAALRWRTLLGANYYIALDRGSPKAGPLGSKVIPPSRTSNQVELEDITSVLRGDARRGLRTLPRELATGLEEPAELRGLLTTLNRVAPAAATGLRAVRGERPDSDLRTLVSASASVVRALDTPTERLRDVVAGAAATLTTTADREQELRETVARAPASLQSTQVTLRRLDRTLTLLDPLVATLQRPAPQIAPTLAALRPTVQRASRMLNSARPLLRSLRPTARSLAQTAREGLPLLQRLTPALDNLDDKVLPYLGEKDPITERSTAQMIGPAIAVYANSGGLVDEIGRAIRFPLGVGNSSTYGPCQTYFNNPDQGKQIACQTLQEALKSVLTWNPQGPAPGTTPPPAAHGKRGR